MIPSYDLDKIKFGTDKATFERAVDLYEKGKVTNFKEFASSAFAEVLGGSSYNVSVSFSHYDRGNCDCYMGERDMLCKHMIAVAIYIVKNGKPLTKEDKELTDTPCCSGQVGELSEYGLHEVKRSITLAMRYIKPYRGPSRLWFAYQSSLFEGCNRLSKIVSELPVSKQTADILVDVLLRLDKKLQGGTDDSDGTVGGFMYKTTNVLEEYAKLDSSCIKSFEKLCDKSTCFEWSDSLIRIFDEGFHEK